MKCYLLSYRCKWILQVFFNLGMAEYTYPVHILYALYLRQPYHTLSLLPTISSPILYTYSVCSSSFSCLSMLSFLTTEATTTSVCFSSCEKLMGIGEGYLVLVEGHGDCGRGAWEEGVVCYWDQSEELLNVRLFRVRSSYNLKLKMNYHYFPRQLLLRSQLASRFPPAGPCCSS